MSTIKRMPQAIEASFILRCNDFGVELHEALNFGHNFTVE